MVKGKGFENLVIDVKDSFTKRSNLHTILNSCDAESVQLAKTAKANVTTLQASKPVRALHIPLNVNKIVSYDSHNVL